MLALMGEGLSYSAWSGQSGNCAELRTLRKMEMQNTGCSTANSYYAFIPPNPPGMQESSCCSVMNLRLSEQQQLDMLRLMSFFWILSDDGLSHWSQFDPV